MATIGGLGRSIGFEGLGLGVFMLCVYGVVAYFIIYLPLSDKWHNEIPIQEWRAASGKIRENARAAAMEHLSDTIRNRLDASIKGSEGVLELKNLPLVYKNGMAESLTEHGFRRSLGGEFNDEEAIEIEQAANIAVKLLAKLHPEMLVDAHLRPCTFNYVGSNGSGSGIFKICGIDMIYQQR